MLGPVLVKYRTGFGDREIYGQLDASSNTECLVVYAPYIVTYNNGVRVLHINHSVNYPMPIEVDRVIEIKTLSDADHVSYSNVLKSRYTAH